MSMTKAVIFDLDGTIVFSHPTHFAAYEKLFSHFGITWTFEEFNQVFAGTGAPKIIAEILGRNRVKDFKLEELVKKKRDLFQEILNGEKLRTVPGFFDFLAEINGLRLKKAIASGSNKDNIISMLSNIGALIEFPVIISGEEVARPKPSPDIFLLAAEKLKIDPSECLVIEDTDHGVIGAKKAGMKCIAFTTTIADEKILLEAGADSICSNYEGIDLNLFR